MTNGRHIGREYETAINERDRLVKKLRKRREELNLQDDNDCGNTMMSDARRELIEQDVERIAHRIKNLDETIATLRGEQRMTAILSLVIVLVLFIVAHHLDYVDLWNANWFGGMMDHESIGGEWSGQHVPGNPQYEWQ